MCGIFPPARAEPCSRILLFLLGVRGLGVLLLFVDGVQLFLLSMLPGGAEAGVWALLARHFRPYMYVYIYIYIERERDR